MGAKGMEVYLAINHHPGTNPTSSQIVFPFIFVALSCSLGHFGVRCWGLVESWTHKEDVLIGKQRVWKGDEGRNYGGGRVPGLGQITW